MHVLFTQFYDKNSDMSILKYNIPQQWHWPAMSFHILVAHGAGTLEGVSHLSVCTLLDDGHVSVIYRLPVERNTTVSIEHYDLYYTPQTQ